MITLRKVRKDINKMNTTISLFGAGRRWKNAYDQAVMTVAQAIMKERGISKEQACKLPPGTRLGPKGEVAYYKLRAVIASGTKKA
jgi:hypothetical protein